MFWNRTLRNAVSSVSGTQESVSQQGLSLSLKFSLKSQIFNKNGQLVGEVGVGTGNDKEVVFVSFNFSILQGQYQRPNHHCHSHSDCSETYLVYLLLAVGKKIRLLQPPPPLEKSWERDVVSLPRLSERRRRLKFRLNRALNNSALSVNFWRKKHDWHLSFFMCYVRDRRETRRDSLQTFFE